MKWLQHDSDAIEDARLQDLAEQYGAEGIGIYWIVVEKIAKKMSPANLTLELEESSKHLAKLVNDKPGIERIDAILKTCLDMGLFTLGPNKRICCLTLLRKLDNASSKNPVYRKMADEMNRFHSHYGTSTKQVRTNFSYLPTDLPTNQQDLPALGDPSLDKSIADLKKSLENDFLPPTVKDQLLEKLERLENAKKKAG